MGDEPILPTGYVPTLPEDNTGGNAYAGHPYLQKMKIGGGPYAILLAFHLSQKKNMTKQEIIGAGQRFCDEAMDANYHAGRMHGAWKGNETLVRHGFIHVNKTTVYREGKGMRSLGAWTYQLTQDGSRFIEAMLDRHPAVKDEIKSIRVSTPQTFDRVNPYQAVAVGRFGAAVSPTRGAVQKPHSALAEKDVEELRSWALSAHAGSQKKFTGGKDRRRAIHVACDILNQQLALSGKGLRHESAGPGRGRALFVTMLTLKSPPTATTPEFTDVPSVSWIQDYEVSRFQSPGRTLLSPDECEQRSPPKRPRLPASWAAAEAALKRQAIQTSTAKKVTSNRKTLGEPLSKDDCDRKQKSRSSATVVNLVDLSATEADDSNVVDLTDSQDSILVPETPKTTPKRSLRILVDSRERNRNATPRMIRTDLGRSFTTGMMKSLWRHFVENVQVVEDRLETGDVNFNLEGRLVCPLLERKTISDIVQRSFRKDHWHQLQRMRDLTPEGSNYFLLLEGEFRDAVHFTPQGASNEQARKPHEHTIDSEESMIHFLGRAMLHLPGARIVQTSSPQTSLRAIASLGLVAAFQEDLTPVRNDDKTRGSAMMDLLCGWGIPSRVAKCLSDALGSKRELDRLYAVSGRGICALQVLSPFLLPLADIDCGGTPDDWSRAIRRAYAEPSVTKRESVKTEFPQLCKLVENHARLLEQMYLCNSNEEALNRVYDAAKESEECTRVVRISLPSCYLEHFPTQHGGASVYDIHQSESEDSLVTMQTSRGEFYSNQLAIFVFEGRDVVRILRDNIDNEALYAKVVQKAAESIRSNCCAARDFNSSIDTGVLLVRGLRCAVDQWARQVGYRQEYCSLVDMVLSHLSLSHSFVVLQVGRLDRKEVIIWLQNMAIACFHHQLLTKQKKFT